MSTLLFIFTLVLNAAGFLFAAVYLWLNVFTDFPDLSDRNAGLLKITATTAILSIVFSFMTSLLSDHKHIKDAVADSTLLFSIIAITGMVVLALCGFVLLFSVVSKSLFKPDIGARIRRLFLIALPSSIVALVLTWLFS